MRAKRRLGLCDPIVPRPPSPGCSTPPRTCAGLEQPDAAAISRPPRGRLASLARVGYRHRRLPAARVAGGLMIETARVPVDDGTQMLVRVAKPAPGAANGGGILVFQEAYGVNDYLLAVTEAPRVWASWPSRRSSFIAAVTARPHCTTIRRRCATRSPKCSPRKGWPPTCVDLRVVTRSRTRRRRAARCRGGLLYGRPHRVSGQR